MEIEFIMLHHSSVSYDKNPNQFEANNRYHKKWNFKSSLGYYLGYNYEISKDGITRQARRDGERTAACYQQGMNNGKAIHICLDGNFSIQLPTIQQKNSLIKLLEELELKYPDAKIIHHRDIKNTQCPGSLISKDWLKNNNKKMKLYLDTKTNKQYIEGNDKVKRHLINTIVLEAFHYMGAIDKNTPLKVDGIDGIIGRPIALIYE